MDPSRTPALTIVCLALLASGLAGCSGKKSANVTISDANVTVEQPNRQMTSVKTDQGEVKVGNVAVDPASLGLPLYPGATQSDANSMTVSSPSKGVEAQVAVLTTADGFDEVYDFYKSRMPAGSEKAKIASAGRQMANFEVGLGSADEKSAVIREADGKVLIRLLHETKQ